MDRIIMHIDVNNAFLSWSAIDLLNKGAKYDIRNSYAVIGGDETKRSGIVLAKSNPCKKLGIKTGETLYVARSKCKALKTYAPNFIFYKEMSNKLFNLINKYTPDIEIASIDECYLDYSKVKNLYGDEIDFAYKLQKEINDTLGFTVNIGIANNKLCAKMASDFEKPNKVHTLYDYEVKTKMYPLDIEDLFGIGKKTSLKLRNLGINKIEDLANYDLEKLKVYFKNMAVNMINSAKGINDDPVFSDEWIPKGIGNEITLEKDEKDPTKLKEYLLDLTENVTLRLRKQKKYAYTVVVTVKTNDFKRCSHQKKMETASNNTDEIYRYVKTVFDEMNLDRPIRLIGVRVDNLTDHVTHQVNLFEKIEEKDNNKILDEVVDNIKSKYGSKIIKKASLINKKEFKNLKD